MTSEAAVSTVLQQWAQNHQLSQATLNAEGTSLTLGDVTLQASEKVSVRVGGDDDNNNNNKELLLFEYSLASLFLQIVDPQQSLLDYRKACKKHKVKDVVKASDKATVVEYFLPPGGAVHNADEAAAAAAAAPTTAPTTAPAAATKEPPEPPPPPPPQDETPKEKSSSKHHRKDKHHHRKDRHGKKRSTASSSSAEKQPKVRKTTIDHEQLFTNLVTVVDKRTSSTKEEGEQNNAQLVKALSPEGFQVTPDLLAEFTEKTQSIVSHEIPVGNSASILKAAAGKDLSRILKLYMETTLPQPPKAASKNNSSSGFKDNMSSSSQDQKKSWRPYLVGQKPVIILPKGMTAPLTMANAHEFFAKSRFVPRELAKKQRLSLETTFKRRVGQRYGGSIVEYELMDNPKSKLQTPKDWDRVVAVVALGHAWQFKDWPDWYSNPVKLFGKTFGFSVGFEGAKIPADLQGWAVVQARLNRDKRGMDSVTHASFWNGLDEFMAIHKPEMLPQPEG